MATANEFHEKKDLLQFLNSDEIQIINLGLEKFARTYQENGMKVVQVDWKPPVEIEEDLSDILSKLS